MRLPTLLYVSLGCGQSLLRALGEYMVQTQGLWGIDDFTSKLGMGLPSGSEC